MQNKASLSYFMRKITKNSLKNPLNHNLTRNFLHMTMIFNFSPLQRNKIDQIVLCGKFRVKRTKLELLFAQKFQKR